MTQPTDTVTALARRFAVEVDMGTPSVPDWQLLIGVEEFKPDRPQRREADESYDDAGAQRQAITGSSWKIEMKIIHRTGLDGVTFNAVQEKLRLAAEANDAATGEVHVRWYDRSGVGESYDGRALVTWTPDGGNGGARDTVAVVLDGQGARVAITNPNSSPLPVITALSPSTGPAAGSTLVTIKGRKFTGVTGATGVKFGATNATSYTLLDDTRIVAVAPAGVAGTVEVTVTTPGGTNAVPGTTANDYVYV